MRKSRSLNFAVLMLAGWLAQPAASAAAEETIGGRYRIGDAGATVTDLKTGLVWQRCEFGRQWSGGRCTGNVRTFNWEQATAVRSDLGGATDWRLPDKDELKSIVHCSNGAAAPLPDRVPCGGGARSPALHADAFPDATASNAWSSSSHEFSPDVAWVIVFGPGYAYYYSKLNGYAVRLVRGR